MFTESVYIMFSRPVIFLTIRTRCCTNGNFKTDLTFDSNFENENNNQWLTDASLITSYKKNLNPNYKIQVESALQTSKNYIQKTKPNDDLSYTN